MMMMEEWYWKKNVALRKNFVVIATTEELTLPEDNLKIFACERGGKKKTKSYITAVILSV